MTLPLSDQSTSPLPRIDVSPMAEPASSRLRWLPVAAVVGVLALGLALTGVIAAGYAYAYRAHVLPGVTFAGIEVGGLSETDAGAAISQRLEQYSTTPIAFEAGAARIQATPGELGVSYDVPAIVAEAMRVGRTGDAGERLADWWPFGRQPHPIAPIGRVDQAAVVRRLGPLLSQVDRPAVDASLQVHPERGVVVLPSSAGQSVDITAATVALQTRVATLSSEPIVLRLQPLPPVKTEAAFNEVKGAADALLKQPFEVRLSDEPASRRWPLSAAELTGMLTLTGDTRQSLTLDESRLAVVLTRVSDEVNRAGHDAELQVDAAGVATVSPHADGVVLDSAASIAGINRAVAQGQYGFTLVTRAAPPAVRTADLEPVRDRVNQLLDRSIAVEAADINRTLVRKELAALIEIVPRADAPAKIDVTVNRTAASDYLATLAKQVNRDARPPAFKFLAGKVTQTAEPVQGRKLDEAAALLSLTDALVHADAAQVKLPVVSVTAPLASVDPSQIVIRDVLATGTTAYGFSLPERKHNVELATQRLNGTLVPPGEWFSFNRAVGRVSTASGYRTGYGIVLTNGAVQTVPSVGGGICQVATTVFHAAFRSGVTIGERNWHFYWIPTYGQAPSGLTGLDATVDEDYGLDFTFRNTTGNWIALETSYDGQNMRITLRGVNPGWETRIGGPQISNVKAHDPTPVEREDSSLPAGRRVQVESARDGMDVAITRTVLKDGQTIDQRTFRSHYEPSQNVTLVGTRPA